MMRSPGSFAVAVRGPKGGIMLRESPWETSSFTRKLSKTPFLRGCVVLAESMHNGISALNWSASIAAPEDEKLSSGGTVATMVFAFALAIGLFTVLPHAVTGGLGWLLGVASMTDGQSLPFHLVDGVVKLAVFVGYIVGISLLPEVRRLFAYHGAEHKAVHAFENGAPLTVEGARDFPVLHKRCGTAFLILVLLISVVVFSLVFPFVPRFSEHLWLNHAVFIAIKIPLVFPIAGLAYEVLKLGSKGGAAGAAAAVLVKPGLWVQHLTTREPDDSQLEVALAALRKVLWREQQGGGVVTAGAVETFADFGGLVAALAPSLPSPSGEGKALASASGEGKALASASGEGKALASASGEGKALASASGEGKALASATAAGLAPLSVLTESSDV
jgi:uncharacterized protein YqhQ